MPHSDMGDSQPRPLGPGQRLGFPVDTIQTNYFSKVNSDPSWPEPGSLVCNYKRVFLNAGVSGFFMEDDFWPSLSPFDTRDASELQEQI